MRLVLTAREQAKCAAPDEVAAIRAQGQDACLKYAHLHHNREPSDKEPGIAMDRRHVDLDDSERFVKVLDIEVPWARSWGGRDDRGSRDSYRRSAADMLGEVPANPLWWAFRIGVHKSGRLLDVDNVAKTIIDAFCAKQIDNDVRNGSPQPIPGLGLYPDDTVEHVRVLQVVGEPGAADRTHIEIFACVE